MDQELPVTKGHSYCQAVYLRNRYPCNQLAITKNIGKNECDFRECLHCVNNEDSDWVEGPLVQNKSRILQELKYLEGSGELLIQGI